VNMNVDIFRRLSDFDNVLVVDDKGIIIFYDMADLNVLIELGIRPEEFMGKSVTSFYKNITNENSTLMNVLRTGKPLCNIKQEMITKTGEVIETINSTFPIAENGKIIGAVEFSKRFFSKDAIQYLDKYSSHKIFRRNNTVYTVDDIITVNPKMESIKDKLGRIALTTSNVLIVGETGTGKELIAQAIHNLSDRFGKPFISLNCSAVPASLWESTLFGTNKGSFTGSEDMPGLFEQAEGGTLFLDEINSLDMNLQVKLLKAIEEKTIRRLGGKKNIRLDIRVISATNEVPDILLAEKRLREDLFYRIGVVQIDLPNLMDRKEDIEVLVDHYLNFYNNTMNIYIDGLQDEVLECFKRYPWPGNIRELKNAVETAYNHVQSSRITLDDIPGRIRDYTEAPMANNNSLNVDSLKDAVQQYEKEIIVRQLKNTNGKMAESARQLGISKQLLKYKMEKHKLR
jgi:arginine utilization regulatory protein